MVETVVRWLLLLVVSGASLLSAYVVAPRFRVTTRMSERWLVTLILAHGFAFSAFWAVSFVSAFDEVWASVAVILVAGGMAIFFGQWRRLKYIKLDARRLVRALPRPSNSFVLLGVVVVALAALSVSISHIVYYPTWSWDCVWYHLAQSRYIVQERSMHYWVDTPVGYINGYPRLIETFSAFTLAVLRSETLDDATQLSWTLVGAVAISAWCRRIQIARTLSMALGLSWILLPAVFLQIHTTHADIAAGALFVAMQYFLWEPKASSKQLVMATVCAGLLLSAKVTGILWVGLSAPIALVQLIRSLQKGRWRQWQWAQVFIVVLALGIGLTQPVRNMIHMGNPVYPAAIQVPLTKIKLPGPFDENSIAGGLSFLRSPNALKDIASKWYREPGVPFPDIRERPFGRTFNYFTLPLAAIGLVLGFRRKRLQSFGILFLAAVSLMSPASWWGRFVLGVPAAALVASGAMIEVFRRRARALSFVAMAMLSAGVSWDYVAHFVGYRQTPQLWGADTYAKNEDRLRAEMTWMFPRHVIESRDREVQAGDVVMFDESVEFFGELWNSSTTSRAVYVSNKMPERFVEQATAMRARWVAIARGSQVERMLVSMGATLVAQHGFGRMVLYRMPKAS